MNGEGTVGTGLIVRGHLLPSGASARKWRSGVENGPPSLRGCAKQLASRRIGTVGGMPVRVWERNGGKSVGCLGTSWSPLFESSESCLLGRLKSLSNLCSLPTVKREATLPPVSPLKAALSEEELEKKSKAIIEEYLHLNDMKVGSGSGV